MYVKKVYPAEKILNTFLWYFKLDRSQTYSSYILDILLRYFVYVRYSNKLLAQISSQCKYIRDYVMKKRVGDIYWVFFNTNDAQTTFVRALKMSKWKVSLYSAHYNVVKQYFSVAEASNSISAGSWQLWTLSTHIACIFWCCLLLRNYTSSIYLPRTQIHI